VELGQKGLLSWTGGGRLTPKASLSSNALVTFSTFFVIKLLTIGRYKAFSACMPAVDKMHACVSSGCIDHSSFLFVAICLCSVDTNLRLDRVNGKRARRGCKGQSWCLVGPVRSYASSTFWLSLIP
jgi:hypothetical protein